MEIFIASFIVALVIASFRAYFMRKKSIVFSYPDEYESIEEFNEYNRVIEEMEK